MQITIFGATGGTGKLLVQQALAAGQEVTAVVRDPARLSTTGSADQARLEVVRADVMAPAEIAPFIAGRDAVISALGPRPGSREPVCAPGATSIIAAMRTAEVRRLVVVSAAGHVVDSADGFATRFLVKPILRRLLRRPFADLAATDAIVTASGLDWTIMRPPRLTNGAPKPYRTAVDHTVRGGSLISRTDLATATLAAAADPTTIGHAIALGY
jgi:putative NADH-flavin reductase